MHELREHFVARRGADARNRLSHLHKRFHPTWKTPNHIQTDEFCGGRRRCPPRPCSFLRPCSQCITDAKRNKIGRRKQEASSATRLPWHVQRISVPEFSITSRNLFWAGRPAYPMMTELGGFLGKADISVAVAARALSLSDCVFHSNGSAGHDLCPQSASMDQTSQDAW